MFANAERALARVTDALIAVSPRVRDELIGVHRIGSREQFRIVPLGFDLARFGAIREADRVAARRSLGFEPATPVVTWVGRLTAIKDPAFFLRVAAAIRAQRRDAAFLLVGDGELRPELEALARVLDLTSLRWLGWQRDLATIYAASDVFMLTSRNEGTPVALIEAMAAGLATVSTDVGGVRDVVGDDQLGVVVARDEQQLTDAALALLCDPERRRCIGNRARQHALVTYSEDRLVRDVAALYKELVPRGG